MSHAADMAGEAARIVDLEGELSCARRETQRLHRELEALRDRLEVERGEREELLAVVSHELRTPITVIGGYLRMLLSGDPGELTPQQLRFLEESGRSVRRLDALVERVLEGCRPGQEGELLDVADARVGPVVEEGAASFAGFLEERGASLVLDLEPSLEARFDQGALERVLMNLVGNAIRYAGKGGRIEIAARRLTGGGRYDVELVVADDGPGVPAADRERIFEPWVQAAQPGRRRGLGLGLAICRRLVEAHGGSIRVDDRAGGGACFAFTLPRAKG